jgi:hypothetical protein
MPEAAGDTERGTSLVTAPSRTNKEVKMFWELDVVCPLMSVTVPSRLTSLPKEWPVNCSPPGPMLSSVRSPGTAAADGAAV